jgi:hypothetical protein
VIRIGSGYPNERPERRTLPRQARKLSPAELGALHARRRYRGGSMWHTLAAGAVWLGACGLAGYLILSL